MKSLKDFILESQKTSNVYIMIGLPGSGKSTWIKDNLDKNIEIISKDQIRKELGIMDDDQKKKIGDAQQEKEVKKIHNERFEDNLKKGNDIVLDNTNIGKTLRYILDRCKYYKAQTIGVNVKTPKEVCMKRRENCISEKVYNDMEKELKWLTDKEVDKVINVEYKS